MRNVSILLVAIAGWLFAGSLSDAAPAHVLKIATVAPAGSAWALKLEALKKQVQEVTDGKVQLRLYLGGVMGDDKDVLFKVKVGQLHGGGFMGAGTCMVCPAAKALMLPLTFQSEEEVDAVMERMQPHLEEESLRNGYVALGWTEIGFTYLYSTRPVGNLQDLRGAKPWMPADSPELVALFSVGRIHAVELGAVDVLTSLQTGIIETVYAPPLAAVAMQWFTKVKYVTDLRILYTFGGLFVSRAAWEKIPEDLRAKIAKACHEQTGDFKKQVRKSNAEALDVMKRNGIQMVQPSPEDLQEFKSVAAAAAVKLQEGSFPSKAWKQVEQYLADVRAKAQERTDGP